MSTIKTVQESIESIRKDMLSQTVVTVVHAGAPPRKSKEEAQREVLDAELDLITRQQEGGDTSELQRRLMELRAQAFNLSKSSAVVGNLGGAGIARRGRGALRGARHHNHFHLMMKNNMSLDNTAKRASGAAQALGAAAAASNKKTVVDHRPTRLLVSGYEADEYESVLAHFSVTFTFYIYNCFPLFLLALLLVIVDIILFPYYSVLFFRLMFLGVFLSVLVLKSLLTFLAWLSFPSMFLWFRIDQLLL